jgi:hypothetical protein
LVPTSHSQKGAQFIKNLYIQTGRTRTDISPQAGTVAVKSVGNGAHFAQTPPIHLPDKPFLLLPCWLSSCARSLPRGGNRLGICLSAYDRKEGDRDRNVECQPQDHAKPKPPPPEHVALLELDFARKSHRAPRDDVYPSPHQSLHDVVQRFSAACMAP